MRVRALKYYYHDRTEHHVGDEFDMDDRAEGEINTLCLIGTLEKVTASKTATVRPAPTQEISTRAMQPAPEPEQSPEPPPVSEEPPRRRYYRRRDMRSEQ